MTARASTLTVRTDDGIARVEVLAGQSVREALDATSLRVRAACGGTGSCGACVVRVLSGEVTPLTVADYMKLTPDERAQGLRLACQMRLTGDAEIGLEQRAPPSVWTSIPPENLLPAGEGLCDLKSHVYGVAVDVGTTHLRVSLWDRRLGRRIAARRGPNPQIAFGADVLSRLAEARSSPQRAHELGTLARAAIVEAVRDMLARDVGEVTPMLAEIGQLVVVGNTAMLALLTEQGREALLDPDNWQRPIDCRPSDANTWREEWCMPNVEVVVAPPVAGFIGSDLTADVIATGLLDGPSGSLLLDVGTNTEIALWDGRVLHVTSVPGGPAFEGGGVRRGMPAEPGAIYRVRRREGGDFECLVLGGGDPKGFCGSGLVDAIAVLLAAGKLRPSGRFAVGQDEPCLLCAGDLHTAVSGSDVDAFQRAKAATAAAMAMLLRRAGMTWSRIRRLCVCGAFGHTLDLGSSREVGLLPPVARVDVELYADATLGGCERALLSRDPEALLRATTRPLVAANMSQETEYDDSYVEHLRLRPFPTE